MTKPHPHPHKHTLDAVFRQLLARAKQTRSLSLREILEILSGKGRVLALIFLALPFCQPLQIPGFSTPFGLLIAFLGVRSAFGKHFWIPKKLAAKKVSSSTVQKIVRKGFYWIKKLQRFIHHRWAWVCRMRWMQAMHGLVIAFLGILLALPLPIPFTNLTAAWAIFLMCLGLLEEDGLLIVLGYVSFLLTLGFFVGILFSIEKIF